MVCTNRNHLISIENYITFWNQLPRYYNGLKKHLSEINAGYQGMVYRLAVDCLDSFITQNTNQFFYFAGFNALNQAEERTDNSTPFKKQFSKNILGYRSGIFK